MVVLLRLINGTEKAVDLSKGGWSAVPVANDMSKIQLKFEDNDDKIFVDLEAYESVKDELKATNQIKDLTTA